MNKKRRRRKTCDCAYVWEGSVYIPRGVPAFSLRSRAIFRKRLCAEAPVL